MCRPVERASDSRLYRPSAKESHKAPLAQDLGTPAGCYVRRSLCELRGFRFSTTLGCALHSPGWSCIHQRSGGSFILSLQRRRATAFWNPTNAVGESFILSLQRQTRHGLLGIPPTQLVDRSYSAYKDAAPRPSGIPPTQLVDRSYST
jgi:hypothetical protein